MGRQRLYMMATMPARVTRTRLIAAQYQGDPFFGFLAPAIAKLGAKLIPKAAGWIGRAGKRTIGGVASKAMKAIKSPIGQAGVGGIAAGAAGGLIGRMGGGGGMRAGGGAYKRIDPTNVKALRRACRRMDGFLKLYKKSAQHLGYRVTRATTAKCSTKKRRCA
jgi:hypothetical protein